VFVREKKEEGEGRVVTFAVIDALELVRSIATVQRKMRIALYGRTTSFSQEESKAQIKRHCFLTLLCCALTFF
jgi:hypothetical protein